MDMKAIVYHNYGSPDVLLCEEIEKPVVGESQVLIKVRAAAVNPLDAGELKGVPYLARLIFGCVNQRRNTLAARALMWPALLAHFGEESSLLSGASSKPASPISLQYSVISFVSISG
jgi:NADPH:quinone reductase-like Zn-dependent oxidoreductase